MSNLLEILEAAHEIIEDAWGQTPDSIRKAAVISVKITDFPTLALVIEARTSQGTIIIPIINADSPDAEVAQAFIRRAFAEMKDEGGVECQPIELSRPPSDPSKIN